MDNNRITSCSCEKCSNVGPVIEMAVAWQPEPMALCQRCAPKAFEAQARKDIDRWLAGDDGVSHGA